MFQSYKQGKPEELLNGVDGSGNLCGVTEEYKEYNLLYYVLHV